MRTIIAAIAMGLLAFAAKADTLNFYTLPLTGTEGEVVTLTVCMENDFDAYGWQCFINLPDGIRPVMNSSGTPAVEWCGREKDHILYSNQVDNQCRVLGDSNTDASFDPGDGPLFTVPLKLDVSPGTYELTLSNGESPNEDYEGIIAPEYTGTITVLPKPTGVELDKTSVEIIVGATETLTATVLPEGATSTLTWTSSNTEVATVEEGVVKAIAIGTTEITVATANGLTATCAVTVKADPTGLAEVTVEEAEASGAEFFDLAGRRIARPAPGLYLLRHNGEVRKVIIR